MSEEIKYKKNLLSHWLENLVGTSTAFSLNLFINLSAGMVYSFKIITSPYLLLIFGVISPILFTICLYSYIRNESTTLLNESLPAVFKSSSGNSLLMIFDICLILGFALLIYQGPLDYFLFRFLQTIFFPCTMLIFLRILYLSNHANSQNDDDIMS
jgi:hypothetical protein